ncbi:MAG: PspC domain-containing protein [Rikenellaceae bacterium]|nr:PspC domain-containing protein [Rikenellaceae bacterium]
MKEIIKASLAGIGFVFDKDAYEITESYIEKLTEIYRSNPDGQEIIADIEARMVEIILSRQSCEQVVDRATAEEVIGQMGTPEEVGDGTPASARTVEDSSFPRRLYRNREGAKLGGVCNGLASYFDIDPVIVRIGFVSPLFLLILFPSVGFHSLNAFLGSLFGALCLLYIILWFAVPAAKTPRQKLEMQGRRITVSEIEREMSAAGAATEAGQSQGVFSKIFSILGIIILFGIKLVLLLIGFIVAITALGILVGIVGVLAGSTWVSGGAVDVLSGTIGPIFTAMLLGVILIPLVMLVYQVIRLALGKRNNARLMWILGGMWALMTVFVTVTVVSNGLSWRDLGNMGYGYENVDQPDADQGWKIYEENVHLYRDSLERMEGGGLPQIVRPLESTGALSEPDTIAGQDEELSQTPEVQ